VLGILLGVLLRLSRRVRVGVGAGVWLSQTSALFAHRREATFQSRSVVQSDIFTKSPQYLSNSISLAVETFCTFISAFQMFPISLDKACSCRPPSNACMARVLALASLVVAITQHRLHLQRLRDLKKDGHAVSMTIPQQDLVARPA
jgi:hypothetical protein